MAYPTRYLEVLEYDPRPKLFGYQAPGVVRARALRLLENRDEDDYLLRHSLRDAKTYGPLAELLDDWQEDGTWGTDRLYMRRMGEVAASDKALRTTIRNLALLSLYGWEPSQEEGFVEEAAEVLLSRSTAEGWIELISPNNPSVPPDERSHAARSDHWPGIAASALLHLGVRDDRIERYLDLLEETQRADGGWLPQSELSRAGGNRDSASLPSHPLHTANFAVALLSHPERSSGEAVRRAAGFLLDAVFTSGRYKKTAKGLWQQLAEPQWGFDALKVLWLAFHCDFGPEDERVMRIARWLAEEQGSNGLWKSRRRHPGPDEGLFLTLKATSAIKHLYDDLGAEAEED